MPEAEPKASHGDPGQGVRLKPRRAAHAKG